MIIPLQNLNRLNKQQVGIGKRWIYEPGTLNYVFNCLEKAKYAIEDLNDIASLINSSQKVTRYHIVYAIMAMDWLKHVTKSILDSLQPTIHTRWKNAQLDVEEKYSDYVKAVRSFVVAHPMHTTKCQTIGLNGDLVCTDMTTVQTELMRFSNQHFVLIPYALNACNVDDGDIFLTCYSRNYYNFEFIQYIHLRWSDIYETAQQYIDLIYRIDKFANQQKRKNPIR